MADPDFPKKPGARPEHVLVIYDADLRRFAAGATVLAQPTKHEKVDGVVIRPKRERRVRGTSGGTER